MLRKIYELKIIDIRQSTVFVQTNPLRRCVRAGISVLPFFGILLLLPLLVQVPQKDMRLFGNDNLLK